MKIIGIIFAVFIVIGIIAGGSGDKSSSVKEAFNEGQEKAREAIGQPSPTLEEKLEEAEEISGYSQRISVISRKMSEALNKRTELAMKWPNWTDNDVIEFAAAGVVLGGLYDETDKLIPPEAMVSVHGKILKGLDLYKQSVSLANKGIDNSDAELINQSASLMLEGTEWITKATEETNEITKKLKQ